MPARDASGPGESVELLQRGPAPPKQEPWASMPNQGAGSAKARDVVDGHVAIIALDRDAVVLTSNPRDIARWGVPAANIVPC